MRLVNNVRLPSRGRRGINARHIEGHRGRTSCSSNHCASEASSPGRTRSTYLGEKRDEREGAMEVVGDRAGGPRAAHSHFQVKVKARAAHSLVVHPSEHLSDDVVELRRRRRARRNRGPCRIHTEGRDHVRSGERPRVHAQRRGRQADLLCYLWLVLGMTGAARTGRQGWKLHAQPAGLKALAATGSIHSP